MEPKGLETAFEVVAWGQPAAWIEEQRVPFFVALASGAEASLFFAVVASVAPYAVVADAPSFEVVVSVVADAPSSAVVVSAVADVLSSEVALFVAVDVLSFAVADALLVAIAACQAADVLFVAAAGDRPFAIAAYRVADARSSEAGPFARGYHFEAALPGWSCPGGYQTFAHGRAAGELHHYCAHHSWCRYLPGLPVHALPLF